RRERIAGHHDQGTLGGSPLRTLGARCFPEATPHGNSAGCRPNSVIQADPAGTQSVFPLSATGSRGFHGHREGLERRLQSHLRTTTGFAISSTAVLALGEAAVRVRALVVSGGLS